jgi:hypothetical protein
MTRRRVVLIGLLGALATAGPAFADPPPGQAFTVAADVEQGLALSVAGSGHEALASQVLFLGTPQATVDRDTGGHWHPTVALGGSEPFGGDSSGVLSGDGATAVVWHTVYDSDPVENDVRFYTEQSGHWTLRTLVSVGDVNAPPMAISRDGTLVAIVLGQTVQLYSWDGTGFSAGPAIAVPPLATTPGTFLTVTLDGPGDLLAVQRHGLDPALSELPGDVLVYRAADGWTTPGSAATAVTAATLSRDGRTLAVTTTGATVRVLTDPGTADPWHRVATFTSASGQPRFGAGLALTANGGTLLVGAPDAGRNGGVQRYVQASGAWHYGGFLAAPVDHSQDADVGPFGGSVTSSADGREIFASGDGADGPGQPFRSWDEFTALP